MELVTRVQNNSCENILHTSTLRLQADMQQKKKSYAAEKRDLLRHLSKLSHEIKLLRVPDKSRFEDSDKPDLGDPDRSHLGDPNKLHFRFRNKQAGPRSTREQKPACGYLPDVSDKPCLEAPDKPRLEAPDKPHFTFRHKQAGARRTREQKPACDSFPDGHTLPPIGDRFQNRPEHKDSDAEQNLLQMFDQEPELKFNENLDIRFSSLALCSELQSGPEQRLSDQRLSDQRLSDQRLSKKNRAAQEGPALRLPQLAQIREEHPQPHWYSGRNSQTFDQKSQESPTVLEKLKEAREMTEGSHSLPSVRDPVRSDVCIPSKPDIYIPSDPDMWIASLPDCGITSESAVSIPSKPDVFVPSNSDICVQSKPQARMVRFSDKVSKVTYKVSLPQISKRCTETSKKRCERLSEVVRSRLNAGRDDWRSAYLDIQDQEERTRTLGEVLYTVRARMRHNQLQLKNSYKPSENRGKDRGEDRGKDRGEDLLTNEEQDKMKRPSNKRRHLIPNQSFQRLHRRSNATRLQNYLMKLSRERRICEWMECEGYRRLHTASPKQEQSPT